MTNVAFAFRCVVGIILVVSAAAKLSRLQEFRLALDQYRLIPRRAVPLAARVVPAAELLVGLLLVLGLGLRPASAAAAFLLLVFAAAVTINLYRGREIDCGCLGIEIEQKIGWRTVARTVVLAGIAVTVAVVDPRLLALDSHLGGHGSSSTTPSDAFAVGLVAVTALLGLTVGEAAAEVFRAARRRVAEQRS